MSIRANCTYACAALAALLAAAGLGGCFSDHTPVAAPTGRDLCSGAQPSGVVRIVDFAFTPAQATVARGGKVTFVNCSSTATEHSSTSDAGVWNSNLLPQYATFEQTYPTAGSFAFHCTPHPFMKGTVVVQ
ncbi:MAG: putative copper-binding protein [Gemmatimonadetes bacterium]|nr:putative copper-binding protein [Gemmatimonadota bacterium]